MLEVVPNVSEGRDEEAVAVLADALAGGGAPVLDVHSDEDHHRSVLTAAGPDIEMLAEGAVRLVEAALETIDLRAHQGAHPRVGVVDVLPFVDLDDDDGAAVPLPLIQDVADRIGRMGIPVLPYGRLTSDGRRPVDYRRGLTRSHLDDDRIAGPREPHRTAGVVLLGLRAPLIAYNVDLAAGGPDKARAVAVDVRGPGLQALGLDLPRQGRVQVSTNLVDPRALGVRHAYDRIAEAAERHGATVGAAELVGLVPDFAFEPGLPGVDADRVVEDRYAEAMRARA